ncbi:MAG TPA: putative baseplate assembly protein [Candidatus Angelobacter sp.]|jgi:hypothetical protein
MKATLQIVCDDTLRRAKIRAARSNGIDSVEVSDDQVTLTVHLLGAVPENLREANLQIQGGVRIKNIKVTELRLYRADDPEQDDCLEVLIDRAGDFSTYTLRFVAVDADGHPTDQTLAGFDPLYAQLPFTFRPGQPTDLDCNEPASCAAPAAEPSDLNYLARDYASFRQLILDRLSLTMPEWQERHVPDEMLAIVEVLAYVADHLAYYQDAVATEAYLGTARQRISVRRHARLVDYFMHEGCNARTWTCLTLMGASDIVLELQQLAFISGYANSADAPDVPVARDQQPPSIVPYEFFEPVGSGPFPVWRAHNEIRFYTWGDRLCCIPAGAISATLTDGWEDEAGDSAASNAQQPPSQSEAATATPLASARKGKKARKNESATTETGKQSDYAAEIGGAQAPPAASERKRRLHLQPGDVLLLEEVLGPETGVAADADPMHRQFIRLTRVTQTMDDLYAKPVVEVEWSQEDALQFPLCLSAKVTATREELHLGAPGATFFPNVSVARGNVVLVDHGSWVENESLGAAALDEAASEPRDDENDPPLVAQKFRPVLSSSPLVFREAIVTSVPAVNAFAQDPHLATPQIEVRSIGALPDGSGPLFSFAELRDPDAFAARLGLEMNAPQWEPSTSYVEGQLVAFGGGVYRCVVAHTSEAGKEPANAPALWTFVSQFMVERLSARTRALLKRLSPTANNGQLYQALLHETQKFIRTWKARADLLNSGPDDFDYVVEMDNDGFAHLRFGDGTMGRTPEPGETFEASYRVGTALAGNVGAEAIDRFSLVADADKNGTSIAPAEIKMLVRNPIAARGGTAPESIDQVQQLAPGSFRRTLQRAITADDYATLAQQFQGVQRAMAELRWTGIRYQVRVAIDALGTERPTAEFLAAVDEYLQPYRRIGHELTVTSAEYVAIRLSLDVNVKPDHLRAHVKKALMDAFSDHTLASGAAGFFHPDNLTFGESISVSHIMAAAQAVDGVQSVTVQKLERLFIGPNDELENGILPIRSFEIAQLDNDPNFPERGILALQLRGGR